jgi:hypothetical protein
LKPKRKRRESGGVPIDTTFNGGHKFKFCSYEGPQAVPARPSGKGRFREGKAFGSGESKMKSGARREVEQGLTAFVHNF